MQKQYQRQGDPKRDDTQNEEKAALVAPSIDHLVEEAEAALAASKAARKPGFICPLCHNNDRNCPFRRFWGKTPEDVEPGARALMSAIEDVLGYIR